MDAGWDSPRDSVFGNYSNSTRWPQPKCAEETALRKEKTSRAPPFPNHLVHRLWKLPPCTYKLLDAKERTALLLVGKTAVVTPLPTACPLPPVPLPGLYLKIKRPRKDQQHLRDAALLVDNWTGVPLAISGWEAVSALLLLGLIILVTIVGNVLVILSVFTHKPLRIVQNFFIVSLAVADLTVAVLVLPLNVAYSLLGRWVFGRHVCTMWLTSDVMCCTASILNLCAIALDRYWAITDPIAYAQKRTMRRVMAMIALVWLLSALICSPPLIGWNDWPDVFTGDTPCRLTSQKGYVIYSSLGSFYIPLLVMTIVYVEIFVATRRRLRERRAKAPKLNTSNKNCTVTLNDCAKENQPDQESVSSETNHNEHPGKHEKRKKKGKKKKAAKGNDLTSNLAAEDSVTEVPRRLSTEENRTPTTNADSPHSRTVSQKDFVVEKRVQQVYQFIEERQKISLSKERRAARTLGIIMGVFVICWLPFFLMYVILPFCDSCCPSGFFINVITWLGYINSALNPIIYTIFNLDFRKAFKKLLRIKDTT